MFFSGEYSETLDKFYRHSCASCSASFWTRDFLFSDSSVFLGDLIVKDTLISGLIFIYLLLDLSSLCYASLNLEFFLIYALGFNVASFTFDKNLGDTRLP
jgi:hypothetical protein